MTENTLGYKTHGTFIESDWEHGKLNNAKMLGFRQDFWNDRKKSLKRRQLLKKEKPE
jgi:hypothetical protein